MHYLIQTTLAELRDAALEVFDGEAWVKAWAEHGGEKYVAHYTEGQAVISGPIMATNPNAPWFEIQCSVPELVTRLAEIGEINFMRDELRKPGHLRGAYKASIASEGNSRSLIRNSLGNVIGVTPNFMICGTNPAGSFMAGEDSEEAEEILGLE